MSTSNQKPNLAQVRKEAHRLLDLGYTPLPALPEKKHPPFSWLEYQTKRPTHEELDLLIEQYQSATGLGIVTTDIFIIDIDLFKDGSPNPFPENPDQREKLFVAPMVKTPGGGHHLYFRAPKNITAKNSVSKIAQNVDVRTSGGFLVVPPTTRKDGSYNWRNSSPIDVSPSDLPNPPDFILKLLEKPPIASLPGPVPLEGPIFDGERDDTLFRLASKWRGLGHEVREIMELLRLHNRHRCAPPLGDNQLKKIARSAGKYEPNDPPEPSIEHVDPGPIPNRLLEIPGFISSVMELTLKTAPRPNKSLAFAGALALLGTLAGRKVQTESDLRTNIYLICLGDSGIGKDHPRKVNKAIMFEIGMGDGIIGSIASGQALEDEVRKTPSCLALTDEMDELLMAIRQDKSGSRQNLPKVMMELFTSASGPYQTRAKANQDRHHIDQPNLCVMGTAVPDPFYNSLSARMMNDGFLARTLIFEAGKLGPRQPGGPIDIPPKILETARFWESNEAQPDWNPKHPKPRIVSPNIEAAAILEQAADDFDEVRNQVQAAGDVTSLSIWARAWEHTSKLALLYAISEDRENPVITPEAAKWAVEFIGHHSRRLIATVHGRVAENDFHALLIKTKNKLRTAPKMTMSRSRLMKNMHVPARDLDQIINVLTEGGEVEVIKGDPTSPNQRGSFYRLVAK